MQIPFRCVYVGLGSERVSREDREGKISPSFALSPPAHLRTQLRLPEMLGPPKIFHHFGSWVSI